MLCYKDFMQIFVFEFKFYEFNLIKDRVMVFLKIFPRN